MKMHKDNITNKLLKAFNVLFLITNAIIVFLSIVGSIAAHFFDKYSRHFHMDVTKLNSVYLLVIICIVIFVLYNLFDKILINCDDKLFLTSFAIINVIRLAICIILMNGIKPFSDFQVAYDIASKNDYSRLIERAHFPQWCNFICLERLLYSVGINKYIFFIGIELVLNAAISLLIYKIAVAMTNNNKVGYAASLFYLLNPSNIFYSMIFKPDTISLVFVMFAVYLYIIMLRNLHMYNNVKFILYSVITSVCIAVGNSFKPIASIYIIAFSLVCLFLILRLNKMSLLIGWAVCVMLFAPINSCVGFCTNAITENVLATSLDKDATWHYLCVGLNTEGEGQIHIGKKSKFYAQARAEYDYNTAVEMTKNMLREDYENASASKILINFSKKFVWIVQDDVFPAYYFNHSTIDIHQLNAFQRIFYKLIALHAVPLSWLCYIIVLCFCLFCVKDLNEHDYGILFCKVSLFGYLCAMMISEGQSRYKSNIMPFLIILSAIGINKYLSKHKVKE